MSNRDFSGRTIKQEFYKKIKNNLEGANLSNCKLIGLNMKNVNLEGANLKNANLSNSILTGSNFKNARLENAILKNVKMDNAILINTDLTGANLSNSTLTRVNLKNAIMKNTNLKKSNLQYSHLEHVKMIKCDLTAANFKESKFTHMSIKETLMNRVNLRESIIRSVKITKSKLNFINFIKTNINSLNLTDCHLQHAKINFSTITKLKFSKIIGSFLNFNYSIVDNFKCDGDTIFSKANIKRTILRHSNIKNTFFIDSDLQLSSFYEEEDQTVSEFFRVSFKNVDLKDSIFKKSKFQYCEFDECNLTNTDLSFTKMISSSFINSKLNGVNLISSYLTSIRFELSNIDTIDISSSKLKHIDFIEVNLYNLTYNAETEFDNTRCINSNIENRDICTEFEFLYHNSIQTNRIIINNQNIKNADCSFTIFEKIMKEPKERLQSGFQIRGQSGIDVGGITRIIHSKFSNQFYRKFFNDNILKDDISFNQLEKASDYLIELTKLTRTVHAHFQEESPGSINFFPIDQDLLNILLADNVNNFIIQNANRKKYHSQKYGEITYNLLKNTNRELIYSNNKISKLVEGTPEKLNKINFNKANNNEKANMLLTTFLTLKGFRKYQQFYNMRNWIQKYWKPEMFTNRLSYTQENIFKRINLNYNGKNVLLSDFEKESNSNKQKIYNLYSPARSMIDYLKESNENRKDFCRWVTGSETYIGSIFINFLIDYQNKLPIAHTCSNTLDIFNNKNLNTIEKWKDTINQSLKSEANIEN